MPKGVEVVEGGPLMNPASPEFQQMLLDAQTHAADKAVGDKKEEKAESKADEKGEDEGVSPTPEAEDKEEVASDDDDLATLKHKLSGVQAELTRVRKQKQGSAEEAQTLKERIATIEGAMQVLKEQKTETTQTAAEKKIHALPDDTLRKNRIAWDDERADARVSARLAEKEGDAEGVKEANARLDVASKMLDLYEAEKDSRTEEKANRKAKDTDTKATLATELDTLFAEVSKAAPEMTDKTSELWKAGQAEFLKLPTLMQNLGPLGELIATAAAIAKNPNLIGKKATAKLVNDIEAAADKAFQKGGSAPSKGTVTAPTVIKNQQDVSDFEAKVAKVLQG
jgi:archaellum component FlaC